jgi:hypothetical protein
VSPGRRSSSTGWNRRGKTRRADPLRILLAVPHSDAVDQGAKIADE